MGRKTTNMPKIKISYLIFGNMIKYVYINKLTDEQFAEAMEVSPRTLRSYKEKPDTISLERLEIFLENMGISIQELLIV